MNQSRKEHFAGWIQALGQEILAESPPPIYMVDDKAYISDINGGYGQRIRRLSETMLVEGGWDSKLSAEFVEEEILRQALWEIQESGQTSNTISLLDRLLEFFDRYDEPRNVYVPLNGVSMTDIHELQFGNVTLMKMTEAQKEVRAEKLETEQDRMRFSQEVRVVPHVEVAVSAEPLKARQIAIDRSREVLDLLRYAVPSLHPDDPNLFVGILGEDEFPLLLTAISLGKVEHLFGSFRQVGFTLELSQAAKESMENSGVFELANFLVTEKKTDYELRLIRALQWFSNSYAQRDPQNKLLGLAICLECLLPVPRSAGGTGMWVAEGTAVLLRDNLSERRAIRNKVLGLYRKRNGIVHGEQSEEIEVSDVDWLTKAVHDLMKAIISRKGDFQDSEGTYIIADWLQDQRIAPKEGLRHSEDTSAQYERRST